MRLRHLNLETFGHFTDRTLDFGAAPQGGSDFHIVFGRNEAGKTTLMEGYLRLLYGFPLNEPYAFKHQRPNLRVGGVLDIDGVEHALTRLPKRSGNLVDAGGQGVPDGLLGNALRGLSQKEYQQLLCLDDETIEAGGEEITKSKGDIGKLLFSAAAGISDLSQVLDEVRSANRQIYLKGGSKSDFAELKRQHDEITKQIKDHDITAQAYRGLRVARDQAVTTEDGLREQKKDLSLRKLRLEVVVKAYPLAAELQAVETQLEPIAHYPRTLDIENDQLIALITRRVELVAQHDQAVQGIAKLTAQRDGLNADPQSLGIAGRLDALGTLKSQVEAGQLDLPKRETELAQEIADLRARLTMIGLNVSGDLDRFVLTDPELTALQQARDGLHDAHKALAAARSEASTAQDNQREAARLVDEAAGDVTGDPDLERLILQAEADDILDRYSAAEHERTTARQRCTASLQKLTRQDVVFDGVPNLPLTPDQAQALSGDLAQAALALKSAKQSVATAAARWDAAKTRMDIAQMSPDLVSDATAAQARAARDTLWAAHLDALDAPSAGAFEGAMREDDRQNQLRAGQSKELAEMRQAERLELETRKDHQAACETCTQAEADVKASRDRLEAHLRAVGLPDTLSAGDFAAWVGDAQVARAAAQAFTLLQDAQQAVIEQAEHLRGALSASLKMEGASLAGLMKIAKSQLTRLQAQQQALKLAQGALRTATAEAGRRDALEQFAQNEVERALTAWRKAVADHLPDLEADVASWDGVQALRSVREADVRIRGLRRQINGITQDSAKFHAELDALGVGAADAPLLDRYAGMQNKVAEAGQVARQIKELDERLADLEADRTSADQALTVLDEQVASLAGLFDDTIPTDSLEQLRAATTTAQEAIALRSRIQDIQRTLMNTLGVATIDEAFKILESHPLEAARIALDDVTAELDRLDPELDRAIETRTGAQIAFDAVGGDNDIALLTETKRTLEERMQAGLLTYIEGRVGHDLAEEAIRRYRDSHRSGMLSATEKAFGDLTQGAYSKLTTQPGAGGDVLMAVQAADGVSKEASAMSKGTRFQLYLALRAAAYDQMAANGTVLPFFCDDVFETFDEDRTRAACTLMQRIGRTGQAIYLTHHQHVVDLAQEVCGDQVKLHLL